MTKTPLEEFLETVLGLEGVAIFPVLMDDAVLNDRVALVKTIWVHAMPSAPAGAWDKDGLILVVDDPTSEDGTISYERITYGDKPVIEAEGIVVWHINP